MNKYKSIFGVGAVVLAAAAFCVGCGEKSTDPDDGVAAEELVGDWRLVSEEEDGKIEYKSDDVEEFYSFTPSGDLVVTYFNKISDFWLESPKDTLGRYTVKGHSLCVRNSCLPYSVFGDTFTITGTGWGYSSDGGSYKYSYRDTFVRDNIANIGTVYSLDPKLRSTYWKKTSENGEERLDINSHITSSYYCFNSVCSVTRTAWYTDGSILAQFVQKCGDENIDRENQWCTSWPDPELVKYDYQLSDGTLGLRPSDSNADYDVWTQYDPFEGRFKSKADSEKDRRVSGPFRD